jgi:hypothetical protein
VGSFLMMGTVIYLEMVKVEKEVENLVVTAVPS